MGETYTEMLAVKKEVNPEEQVTDCFYQVESIKVHAQ